MNPIPLTDPAGVVRAHACGACGSSYGQATNGRAISDELIARIANSTHGRAERCCRCFECGIDVTAASIFCGPCSAAFDDRLRWRDFGMVWRWIGEAAHREITSEAEWDAWCAALRELDE